MKIALLGYGKMGKLIEQEALKHGYTVTAKATKSGFAGLLDEADICIDFSHANCLLEHLHIAGQASKNVVIGTTGWEEHLPAVKKLAENYGIGILYAPNFSLGIYLFRQIVQEAAKLIKLHTHYKVSGNEIHHKHKADAPSGTAKLLAQDLAEILERNTPLTFSSERSGEIPGIHSVTFDCSTDTISFTHQAHNREGFALGALEAARWLQGKKGFYTLDDMMKKETVCFQEL